MLQSDITSGKAYGTATINGNKKYARVNVILLGSVTLFLLVTIFYKNFGFL